MSFIRIEDDHKSFNAGEVRKHKDYHVVYFNKRPLWLLLRNKYYNEIMGMDFPNEHYGSKQLVPIYNIMKSGRKVGFFLPRISERTGNDFLFCPRNRNIKKNYYIWFLEDNHTIPNNANVDRML